MKFCPQCGTFFEPEARFCLECGFDRSTVESLSPTLPISPEVVISDKENNTVEPAEVTKSYSEITLACPQCGTALIPGDRFCLECGFDTSGKQDVAVDVPQEIQPPIIEEETIKESSVEETVSTPGNKQYCPQCGSGIDVDERFCQECGFDTSGKKDVAEDVPQEIQPPIIEEETIKESSVEETVSTPGNKQFCPQCGSGIDVDERFCQECRFDTSGKKDVAEDDPQEIQPPIIEEETIEESSVEEAVSTPGNKQYCPQCGSGIDVDERFCQECGFDTKSDEIESDIKPEPAIIPPVAEKQPIAKPVISQPEPEPVRQASPINYQTSQKEKPAFQQKEKRTWQLIVMIIIGAGILGTAGWFGYNMYLAPSKETTANSSANTRPMSLMDQELAKHRAKDQKQGTQQNTSDEDAMESAMVEAKKIPSKVILEVGKAEEPKNKNPKNPAKLTISRPTMITLITTDHYNDGMGTPRGGIITIKDRSGMVVAAYKALGKTGKNGTPSAKWVVEPNKIFNKGTYFIWDSDPITWSKTFVGSNGFIVVEGYEVP